jgi:hypothetical protein
MNRTFGRREDVDCATPLADINAALIVAARNSRRVTVGTIGTYLLTLCLDALKRPESIRARV